MGSVADKVKIIISGDARDAEKAFKEVSKTAKKSMAVVSAATAATAAGFITASKSIIDTSSRFEDYGVRLRAVLGSTAEGNRLFQDMTKFAGQVPFAFDDIMASATQMAGVMKGGVSEVNKYMPMVADLAAVSGLSIQETTAQVVRMYSAGAASADLFRERGILSMLGFQAGVSVSAADTRKQLIAAFEDPASKFRGASVEMAKTWTGLTSMMGDKWTLFKKDIGDAGLFVYFKAIAKTINDDLGGSIDKQHKLAKKVSESIISFAESSALGIASVMDSMSGPMDMAAKEVNSIWIGFNKLPDWAKEVGVLGALVGGKKGVLLVAGVAALGDAADRTGKLLGLVAAGQISFWDAAHMNADEATAAIGRFDKKVNDLGESTGKAGNGSPLIDPSAAGDSNRAKIQAFFTKLHESIKDMQNTASQKTGPQKSGTPEADVVDPKLAARFAKLDESLLSEEQRTEQSYMKRIQIVADAIDQGLVSEQRGMELSTKLSEQFAKAKYKVEKQAADARLSLAAGALGALSTLLANGGKQAFEASKALSIAETVVSTYSAAQKAYESQLSIPTPDAPARAAIAAGIAVAQGVARVAAIASTSYGSRSASTAAGGSATPGGIASQQGYGQPAPSQAQQSQQPVEHVYQVDLRGHEFVSTELLRRLADQQAQDKVDGIVSRIEMTG